MIEFQHLKKIYDIKDLCPASSSIEITAEVDLTYDQSQWPDLGSIDLSPSESSESLESFVSGDSDWDVDYIAFLEEEMEQTKETEQVDPEVRFFCTASVFNVRILGSAIIYNMIYHFEFKTILDLIMVAIGIPANIIVLFVSIYNFNKSKSETILLINLALADLLQLRKGFLKNMTNKIQAPVHGKPQKVSI